MVINISMYQLHAANRNYKYQLIEKTTHKKLGTFLQHWTQITKY